MVIEKMRLAMNKILAHTYNTHIDLGTARYHCDSQLTYRYSKSPRPILMPRLLDASEFIIVSRYMKYYEYCIYDVVTVCYVLCTIHLSCMMYLII